MRRLAPALSSWNKEYEHPPIAYIIFNRPRHTRETFAAIRAQQPAKLFIIADGPRPGHPTDAERCREVQEIVEQIDWPCEVYRNYADENLGLKRRVSSGLDWVFEKVDRVIVLEDDCLPHPDFFGFCETLLERYENDERVWVITGNNFQDVPKKEENQSRAMRVIQFKYLRSHTPIIFTEIKPGPQNNGYSSHSPFCI